jgi:hypothetical protein
MKKALLIFALFAALAANYCRTPAPATKPLPENYQAPKPGQIAQNVAVGDGSAQSCYPNADFMLAFETGLVTVSLDGEVCHYTGEAYMESPGVWVGVWGDGDNYVRIYACGATEASIGRFFLKFNPAE